MTPETYHKGGQLLRQIESTKMAIRFWNEEVKTPRDFVRKYLAAELRDWDDIDPAYIPEPAFPTDGEFAYLKRCLLGRLSAQLEQVETEFSKL